MPTKCTCPPKPGVANLQNIANTSVENVSGVPVPTTDIIENLLAVPVPVTNVIENFSAVPVPATNVIENLSAVPVPATNVIENLSAVPAPATNVIENISAVPVPATNVIENLPADPVPATNLIENILAAPVSPTPTTTIIDTASMSNNMMSTVVEAEVKNGRGWKFWLWPGWGSWRPEFEFKVEYLMVLGTIGTGLLLYSNYNRICRIKERRKKRLKKASSSINRAADLFHSCEADVELYDTEKERSERNIFVRIFTFDGLFESREKVDRLLNFIWIPSVERGLSFWKIRKKKHQPAWHYSELMAGPLLGDESEANGASPGSKKKKYSANIEYLIRVSYIFSQGGMKSVVALSETVEYFWMSEGDELFRTDESNFNIYIVLSGSLRLTFQDEDGQEHPIKELHGGDQVISLLSLLDYVLGNREVNCVVQAVAQTESEIMQIGMADLVKIFMPNEQLFSVVLKRLVRRTYGVIFTACHNILGMTNELIASVPRLPTKPLDDIKLLHKPSPAVIHDATTKLKNFLLLKHEDTSLLSNCTCIVVPPDFVLFEAGQMTSKEVIFVSDGELEVTMEAGTEAGEFVTHKPTPFHVNAGEIFGILAMLTDEARHFDLKTSAPSILVIIPVDALTKLTTQYPSTLKPMVNSVFTRMSHLARQMDYGLEWTYYESGEDIFRANDEPVATYLVLYGRLRSYLPRNNRVDPSDMLSEYGKFDFIGLPEMWTKRRRTKTVRAVRDSEIAKIPYDFLRYITQRYAKVAFQILQYITLRVASNYKTSTDDKDNNIAALSHSTFAIFPASPDAPLAYMARVFEYEYEKHGNIFRIDSSLVRKRFGHREYDYDIDAGSISGLTPWLAYLESTYTRVVYVADPVVNLWSTKCFHQADMILVVVNSDGNKDISEMERMIIEGKSLAKKELWICHQFQEGFPLKAPRYSKMWLEKRRWLSCHHHVYVNSRYYGMSVERTHQLNLSNFGDNGDVARIVRWLTGTAFGIALGGGGAKGAALIGFLRQFAKTLLPIDMICGVSIGCFVGALMAIFQDIDTVEVIMRQWFQKLAHSNSYLLDLTFPYVSIFQGEAINHSLIEIFGDTQIEDMRIPFFCCTTDLTDNSIREHRCGSLWRYVRASMTLINYFPPVCDPKDGHYLIDGGYTNLVPADIMRKIGMKYVLALDISSKPNTHRFTHYGDAISGINILCHLSPLPKANPVIIPSCFEIQGRLNWAQSVVYLNLVKKMELLEVSDKAPSVIYLRLPIDFYSTGDFNRFDNIRNIGHEFAKRVLENVSPGDSIQEIWTKMKINREAQRIDDANTSAEGLNAYNLNKKEFEDAVEAPHLTMSSTFRPGVDLNATSLVLYGSYLNISPDDSLDHLSSNEPVSTNSKLRVDSN